MATTLTIAQLQQMQSQITEGTLTLDQFYQTMENNGYNYAYLADGVVDQNTVAGAVAVDFMINSAGQQGVNLTGTQGAQIISNIETQMATQWLQELIINATNGVVDSDLTYQQTETFHQAVFQSFGLGPQTWTLYTPGQVLGPQLIEQRWESILAGASNSVGSALTTLTADNALIQDMAICAIALPNAQSRSAAQSWLAQVTGAFVGAGISPSDVFFYLLNPSINSTITADLQRTPLDTIDSVTVSLGQNVNIQNLANQLTEAEIPLSSTQVASSDSDISDVGNPTADAAANAAARQQLYNQYLTTLQDLVVQGNNSTADAVATDASGNQINTLQGWNATTGTSYQQVTTTSTSGAITADISGIGDVTTLNNAAITIENSTTTIINGTGNAIKVGSDDNLTLLPDPNNTAAGDSNTILAATGADLATDTLNFDGNSIAGNIASGGTDQYGRTYTLSGTTLTITSGSDTLTIGGFQSGDFGLSLGPVFMTINLPSNFASPSASGINDAGVVVGNEVVNQGNAGAYSAGFIDSNGTVSIVSYGGGSTFVNGISNSGVLALQADYNYAAYGAEDNNGAVTIVSNGPRYSAQQVVNLTGVNSSGEAVGMYYGDDYGFVYKNGVFTTLIDPSLPSNALVWPLGVNDAGVIFGWIEAGTGGAFRSGFVDNGGVFTSINDPNAVNGGFTEVTGVNASGEVVGYYNSGDNGIQHGFVEADGNFQTVDDPGMTQTVISGVNDSGETTGYAYESNGTEIAFTATVPVPVCYLASTHILTPTGEALVENLKIGDLVVTRFSGIQPIKWIGRQSYNSRFIRTNRAHIPVCIHAGALADHMPARDLYISPGHSMLVDGQLVLAWSLVNGISITQVVSPPEIHYFQIELEHHDCVIAEGTWSETFADGPGLRDKFHNAGEFAELYPDHPPPLELSLCAPRPEHGPRLDAALRPIVARTAATVQPGPLRGYIDRIEAPWAIDGWAQDTDHPELPVLLEVLLSDQVIATTLACDYRQDLQDAGIGQGRSAFFLISPVRLRPEMLATLRVRRASDHAEIQMTPECHARIEAMQPAQATPGVRLVA